MTSYLGKLLRQARREQWKSDHAVTGVEELDELMFGEPEPLDDENCDPWEQQTRDDFQESRGFKPGQPDNNPVSHDWVDQGDDDLEDDDEDW